MKPLQSYAASRDKGSCLSLGIDESQRRVRSIYSHNRGCPVYLEDRLTTDGSTILQASTIRPDEGLAESEESQQASEKIVLL